MFGHKTNKWGPNWNIKEKKGGAGGEISGE